MRQYTVVTIKRKIFVAMLLVPLLPVLIALGTGSYVHSTYVHKNDLSHVSQIANSLSTTIDRYIHDCLGDLSLIGSSVFNIQNISNLKNILEIIQNKRKEILDIALIDAQGSVISYAGPVLFTGAHIIPGDWFAQALERGFGVGDVQIGQMGVPHFVLACRVLHDEQVYVLRIALDISVFDQILRGMREESVEIFLTNAEGELLAGDGQVLTRERNLPQLENWSRQGRVFFDSDTGQAQASRVMSQIGWILTVRKHAALTFTSQDSVFLFLGLSMLGGGIVILFSSLYLSGYIEKMLQQRDMEREKLREQLYRAGRLAELGEMATGFAHEINNPLQIMKSDQAYIEMVLRDFQEHCADEPKCLEDITEMTSSVEQIKVQIDRCARITHSILRFGRAGTLDVQHVNLAKFIPEVLTMVRKKSQISGIDLRVEMASPKLIVNVDPGRLQQVLLNLINNAMYAIQEASDRRVGEIVLGCGLDKDGRVRIQVTDNGVGIGPEHQKLIFTPFFTTKPPGGGTGLGLSVCHDLVDQMNGVLDFVSRKGEGTTFFITLPRVPSA